MKVKSRLVDFDDFVEGVSNRDISYSLVSVESHQNHQIYKLNLQVIKNERIRELKLGQFEVTTKKLEVTKSTESKIRGSK